MTEQTTLDRSQAAMHYLGQALDALSDVMRRCWTAYDEQAANNLGKGFTQIIFSYNLANFTSVNEVLEFWDTVSAIQVAERCYLGEYIAALHQRFTLFVEPPVDSRGELTSLGKHLVLAITSFRPSKSPTDSDMQGYLEFLDDVPGVTALTEILAAFPWFAVLLLLGFVPSTDVVTVLDAFHAAAQAKAAGSKE